MHQGKSSGFALIEKINAGPMTRAIPFSPSTQARDFPLWVTGFPQQTNGSAGVLQEVAAVPLGSRPASELDESPGLRKGVVS
jgi:hypothetical protein